MKTKDGKEFTKDGMPTAGLEELKKKYEICASYVLPEEKITETMNLVLGLEKLDNINQLTQLLY